MWGWRVWGLVEAAGGDRSGPFGWRWRRPRHGVGDAFPDVRIEWGPVLPLVADLVEDCQQERVLA